MKYRAVCAWQKESNDGARVTTMSQQQTMIACTIDGTSLLEVSSLASSFTYHGYADGSAGHLKALEPAAAKTSGSSSASFFRFCTSPFFISGSDGFVKRRGLHVSQPRSEEGADRPAPGNFTWRCALKAGPFQPGPSRNGEEPSGNCAPLACLLACLLALY